MNDDSGRGFSGLSSLASAGKSDQDENHSPAESPNSVFSTEVNSKPITGSTESVKRRSALKPITNGLDATGVLVVSLLSLTAVLLLWRTGLTRELPIYFALSGFLLVLSAINLQTMRLPNKINLYGSISAVVLCLVLTPEQWSHSLIGGLTGGCLWILVGLLGRLIFKKEMVGMGVIKMGAMIGIFIGPARSVGALIFTIALAIFILPFSKRQRKGLSPFGPFLAAGTLLVLLIGEQVWSWYIRVVFANP